MLRPPRSMGWVYTVLFGLLGLMLLCTLLSTLLNNLGITALLLIFVLFVIGLLIFWHIKNTERLKQEQAIYQKHVGQRHQLQAQLLAYTSSSKCSTKRFASVRQRHADHTKRNKNASSSPRILAVSSQ